MFIWKKRVNKKVQLNAKRGISIRENVSENDNGQRGLVLYMYCHMLQVCPTTVVYRLLTDISCQKLRAVTNAFASLRALI